MEIFQPDFSKGLLPAIAQNAENGEVLMLAWMNEEAWKQTLATREAHYYSRSRKKIWHKGEESGHVQKIRSICLDCDNDAILLLVDQVGGAACHTGYATCFFREFTDEGMRIRSQKVFDPDLVYGKK